MILTHKIGKVRFQIKNRTVKRLFNGMVETDEGACAACYLRSKFFFFFKFGKCL